MPIISVQHCLRDFSFRVQDSLNLSQEAYLFRIKSPDGKYRSIGIRRIELFAGLALFRIQMAWETFLENVFLRYMCGAMSASGYSTILLGNPRPSISDAMNELLSPSLRYLNWTPTDVLYRANNYFDQGEPFSSTISAITQTLREIAGVRNCLAHRSEYATQEFRSVVRRSFGYLPRGINPGRFLLMINPSPLAGSQKFLEFYANILLGAGQSIVP